MKRQELEKLKNILKPLIKECIREAIFEEGVLSTLVAEVASGLGPNTIVESPAAAPIIEHRDDSAIRERINETKRKMRNAIGETAYGGVDIFEGTKPLSGGGNPGATPSASPLANMDPDDKGVNIDSLVGLFGNKWNALK